MNIINLTPHAITIVANNEIVRSIAPSGNLARVATKQVQTGELDGIPVFATEYGDVSGLPDPATDTAYIVSILVAGRTNGRTDVYVPDSGRAVRDAGGQIIGVPGLIQL